MFKFKTMTARYNGVCKRCHAPILPGDTIRYGGPGRTYHLAEDCPQIVATRGVKSQPVARPSAVPHVEEDVHMETWDGEQDF